MPKFIIIQNNMIHVPSIARVYQGTNCFGITYLCIQTHMNNTLTFYYPGFTEAQEDLLRIEKAIQEIEALWINVPHSELEQLQMQCKNGLDEVEKIQKEINRFASIEALSKNEIDEFRSEQWKHTIKVKDTIDQLCAAAVDLTKEVPIESASIQKSLENLKKMKEEIEKEIQLKKDASKGQTKDAE
jgi:chromosome segregation ATPase